MFRKKKNELNNANKLQINQIFIRRIMSYLKKDSLLGSFISCVKTLNAPFSSRLRNNPRTHFVFSFCSFSFQIKPLVAKTKCLPQSDMISKKLPNPELIYYNVILMTDVFKTIVKYRRKIIATYCQISLFIAQWEPSLTIA